MNWTDLYGLISWDDLSKKEYKETPFLINPYIPRNGITLLWGETSTGKSPLGWHMAAAIGRGVSFFGLPVSQGKVLYLEVDTPQRLVAGRIQCIPPSPNVDFLFLPPLSVPVVERTALEALKGAALQNYDCVIVNTLRKVHSLDDKEPQTPKLVYEFFQKNFPGAALVFVHHTKKTQINPHGDSIGRSKESFSGAMNWLNDAQVGIHIIPYRSKLEGINKRLVHQKSQVSDLYRPLGLQLEADGATLRAPAAERLDYVAHLLLDSPIRGTKLDQLVSDEMKVSLSTAHRLRKTVEDGAYPGVEWLGRASSEEPEEDFA